MENTKKKKVSLVRCAVYRIISNLLILATQSYFILRPKIFPGPVYVGQIYLPLLISILILILFVGVSVFTIKQNCNKEKVDELASLNRFKAGYVTKYIMAFLVIFAIIVVKDFNIIFTDDTVGNVITILLIVMCTTELIEDIIFIILEKRNVE